MAYKTNIKKPASSLLKGAHRNYGLLQTIQPLIRELALCHSLSKDEGSVDLIALNYALNFINGAPVIAAFLDLDFVFLAASKPWHKWFANWFMDREEKMDSLMGIKIFKFSPHFPSTILKAIELSRKGKNLCYDFLEIETFQHHKRWIKLETFPWAGHKKIVQGIVVFCEDVTEQQKLLFDNQNLHHTNEMLQNFSLIFSHDLIQPLRQIYNHTYFLEEYIRQTFSPDHPLGDLFDPIKKCVNRAKNLCEGIVFYCRHGDLTINPEEIRLSEILKDISETCFENTNITFKNLTDPELRLMANKTSILQLFQNLLDNAIKHGNAEFPIITLQARKIKRGFYKFDLHNNSYCPKKVKRKKIFDAFESSKCNGAGLGLMICKKIVTAYGGTIVFKSSPHNGTTVSFTLPSCGPHEQEDEQYLPSKIKSDESDHKILETKKTCE